MSLELRFQPAKEGDAIWVLWGDDLEFQMLVDLGQDGSGREIRKRILELPDDARTFELLVVTHVDADHIGGVLTGLVGDPPIDKLVFNDVWFNGWPHLHGKRVRAPGEPGGLEPMGAVQGEKLSEWLAEGPWNEAFDRGPVERPDDAARVIDLAGGMTVTVLGPVRARLEQMITKWTIEVEQAIAKGSLPSGTLEPLGGRPTDPDLTSWPDLEALANTPSDPDDSESNGTSICLLLEWRGRRVLLTGDAFAPDVTDGLALLGDEPLAIDVVKLPHHGSEGNLSDELVAAVTCPTWVVSTNGSKHFHPDQVAIARLLREDNKPRPHLCFNEPSEFNEWWCRAEREQQFEYTTERGTEEDGLVVSLEPVE